MLAKVNSSAVVGLDAVPIEVEIDIAAQGLPSFTKTGTMHEMYREVASYVHERNSNKCGIN